MRVFCLNSDEGGHTGRSGYPCITSYLPHCEEIRVPRRRSSSIPFRIGRRMLAAGAVSSWIQPSSLKLEWRGWQHRRLANAIVHYLWADRDWGYLDLLPGMRGVPMMGTFHACPDDFANTITKPSRLKRLSAAILMSECQRDGFLAAGMSEDRLHVIHHGIDTNHFRPADEPRGATTRPFRVLHVGSYRRNFDVLDEVCKQLSESREIEIVVIVSPAFASRFTGRSNIVVRHRLSDDELLHEYQIADCLLMTAEAATANNAILEGMSCGLPVVAERVGGIPEYVNDACAFLSSPLDAAALVTCVKTLADSASIRDRMSIAARERALQLDWSKVAVATQAVYDQVFADCLS